MIIVAIPAHNEADQIGETLASVFGQTRQPRSCIVIADNCTDNTVKIARACGASVFTTHDNSYKKAGALNQWLEVALPLLQDSDYILVMDADSTLDEAFIANALSWIQKGYAACGGVFSGKPGGGFVGMLQRNEYARYARDVDRKKGKTLVLTGTATLFTVGCLRDVAQARRAGNIHHRKRLPKHALGVPQSADAEPIATGVYDTHVLTEDNELTFALLHLGYKIIAPTECRLQTEVMQSWHDLWKQRHRWKRGAIENNTQYGLTRYTAKYWGLQIWSLLGIVVTLIYILGTVYVLAFSHLHLYKIWILLTIFYCLERAITVRRRGWKQSLLASVLVVEMTFDMFLQAVHLKAFTDALRRAEKVW